MGRPYRKSAAAIAARAAYKAPAERGNTVPGWKYRGGTPRTAIYSKGKNRLISYRGTHTVTDAVRTWPALAFGGTIPYTKKDLAIYDKVKKNTSGKVYVTGHSLGADRARAVAQQRPGVRGHTYNSGSHVFGSLFKAARVAKAAYSKDIPGMLMAASKPAASAKIKGIARTNPKDWSWKYGLFNPLIKHQDY